MSLPVKTSGGKMGNDFEHYRDARGRVQLRIRCASCTNTESVALNKAAPTCNQAFANKKFKQLGWMLGSTRKKDECPSCSTTRRQVEQFAPGMLDTLRALPPTEHAQAHGVEPEHAVDSYGDQLITDYIRGHLRRNAQGRMVYLTGYTDAKMLADLSSDFPELTLKKVRAIRVANFGEARVRRPTDKTASDGERIAHLEEQLVVAAQALEEEKRQRLELTRRVDALAELVEMYVGPRGRSRRT